MKRVRLVGCILTVLAVGGAINPAVAQHDSARETALAAGAKLLGVFDNGTGAWIDRATVRDTLGNQVVTSNIGVALLNGLEPVAGYYMLEIRREGYAPRHFKLRADTTSEFLVSLEPNPLGKATALPAVITTDRRRIIEDAGEREGFSARCQMSLVECVGRKDLDLEPTGQLVQLLKKTFGIYSRCTMSYPTSLRATHAGNCGISMKGGIGECTPMYFLNGYEWSPLGEKSQDQLDQFLNSTVIEGIEVYLTDMPTPARFAPDPNPAKSCGVIVIWTR